MVEYVQVSNISVKHATVVVYKSNRFKCKIVQENINCYFLHKYRIGILTLFSLNIDVFFEQIRHTHTHINLYIFLSAYKNFLNNGGTI